MSKSGFQNKEKSFLKPAATYAMNHQKMLIMSKLIVLIVGETLQDERVNGGAFTGPDGLQFPPKLIPVS